MRLRLFDLMAEKKVTQQQLSQATGISQGNISDWKNGRSSPKADALIKIANYFHVSTDYLLGLTDDPRPAAVPSPADALMVLLASLPESRRAEAERYLRFLTDEGERS